jgi:hypothetical protein
MKCRFIVLMLLIFCGHPLFCPQVLLCSAQNSSLIGSPIVPASKDSSSTAPDSAALKNAMRPVDTVEKEPEGSQKILQLFGKSMDTILVLTAKTQEKFLKAFADKRRTTRERGIGGCIGFSPGIFWIDMDPVRSLARRVKELNDINFDLSGRYKSLSLMGGLLYGGLGNGMRIGLEGRGGSRSITKDAGDTTYFMDISMGYGGLLLEKSFVVKDINLQLGAVMGAGGVTVDRNHSVGGSGFSSFNESQGEPDGSASATIMLLQVHGGFTYSVFPWLHIGVSGAAPMFFSPGGFQGRDGRNITDGFSTVNYGLQLRIMLGNLG